MVWVEGDFRDGQGGLWGHVDDNSAPGLAIQRGGSLFVVHKGAGAIRHRLQLGIQLAHHLSQSRQPERHCDTLKISLGDEIAVQRLG
jgi:hypothetical protein